MKRIKQLKGFTLIELIVVVIIIGVLAAIAAVAYNQFVGNARETGIEASAKKANDFIAAKSTQADKPAADLTGADGLVVDAAGVLTDVAGGTPVTEGATTGDGKFLVDGGTRKACVTFGSVPGEPGTITYNTVDPTDPSTGVDNTTSFVC